jgi:hypothetical protein
MPAPIFRRGSAKRRPAPQWSRQKMRALLGGAGLCTALLAFGLVLAVGYAFTPAVHRSSQHTPRSISSASRSQPDTRVEAVSDIAESRDALAAAAMPTVSQDDSHPGPVSTADPGTAITLPGSSTTGPAGVPSGFPHTSAGALAQLASIDQAAFQSGSLAGVRQVIAGWAMPGGPTASSWSVVAALSTLFGSAGLSGGGSTQLAIVLTPLMGEIKGSIGTDFVVPCVDFELDVTLTQTARGAIADCQRMLWTVGPRSSNTGDVSSASSSAGGRWMIGPGAEPATPPSVWPDTTAAISVGYRDLHPAPTHD